jgi:CBS-domain-containing membrane protein
MSPRAACRLETLRFEHVYDYVPGKLDWLARQLPREGERAEEQRAGDVARDDVVTARLRDRVEEIRPRVAASPYGFGFVVADDGTLLGRLRKTALESASKTTAESVMEPGPSTIRADTALDGLRKRLEERGLKTAVVTTPEGKLLGVVRLSDLP